MELHPSQRRVSCELCRKNKAKCQRLQPDDPKCVRCTLNNVLCDSGQQRKVGRPKRKDPTSSSSVGQNTHVAKRRRKTAKASSQPKSSSTSRQTGDASVKDRSGPRDEYQEFSRAYMQESEVSQFFPGVKSAVSTSNLGPPDLEWLGWPTIMTDRWCRKMIPGAASGRILTNSESGSPPDTRINRPADLSMDESSTGTAYDPLLMLPDYADQAIFQGSLAWINPDLWISPGSNHNHGVVEKKQKRVLPFGIGRQPAYYVHENGFSSNPKDAVLDFPNVDGSSAMVRLLSIVYGLRLRNTLVQNNRAKMNLSLLIHRRGPLFIGTYSLSEYVMTSAQELEQLVTILLKKMGTSCRPGEQLSACLLSTIVDVYCRVLSFFELFLEHLTARAERYSSDPVVPIPGLMFNGVVLTGPCTQGVLFSSSVYHLLGRLENVLGLDPISENGLLSSYQLDELCNKLDRSNGLAQGRGIMRPADVRKLFSQVATILERLSANEP